MINIKNRFIIDNMPFPIWIMGINQNYIVSNKEFKKLYRSSVDEIINKEELYSSKINKVIKDGVVCKFEVTIEGISSQCYLSPYLDEDNHILGVMFALIDISRSKKEKEEIKKQQDILRTIIDTLPEYIFYKDRDCRYIGYNKKWREYYEKLGIESMIGKSDFECGAISEDMAKYFMQQDEEVMKSKTMKIIENRFVDLDGKERIEETIKVPVVSDCGEVWGIVGLGSDVTEKAELKEKLTRLSYTDTLTEVYNRAYFEQKKEDLNNENYLPIGIIMGDVNGLKIVNDTFGHLEGDKLLKSMAAILKNVASEDDYIFRWGGDEFVILMPNCDESKCENIISEIINKCKNSKFDLIEMSISLGSSVKYSLDGDIHSNLREAEEELYREKFLHEKGIRSSIIFSLSHKLHENNIETEQHAYRLVKYALKIGQRLGFTTAQLDELELITKLHDIGKIGVSKDILLKSGKLTKEEFEIIKTHTEKGYRILKASGELSYIARSILTHHEKYDGTGYPLGLAGEDIPLMARIVNVVDSYDAMTMDNGYSKVKTKIEAIEEIKNCMNTQFDPNIAQVFIDILENE